MTTLLVLLAAPAMAGNLELGRKIASSGNERGATACVACHGAHGEGMPAAGFPRLAGLPEAYLDAQLQAFVEGRRSSDTMKPVDKDLTDAERQAVSAWYASLPAVAAPAPTPADAGLLAAGGRLAEEGDWSAGLDQGIPACVSCHGPGARGAGPAFPPLAGQNAQYIVAQIAAWKSGKRHGDPQGLMAAVAGRLSDAQTRAVSAWLARQPTTPAPTSMEKKP